MSMTTSQQVRLVLVQQQGKLEINTPAEVDIWVNYILSGLPSATVAPNFNTTNMTAGVSGIIV